MTILKDTLFFAAVTALIVISMSTVLNAQDLEFTHDTSSSYTLDLKKPTCVYLFRKYRPVNKLAGQFGCSAKGEIALFKATGKRLIKLNKKKLGDSLYSKIEAAYLRSLK